MRFAVAGELRRRQSERNFVSGVSEKGHTLVRLLKGVFWGLEERC